MFIVTSNNVTRKPVLWKGYSTDYLSEKDQHVDSKKWQPGYNTTYAVPPLLIQTGRPQLLRYPQLEKVQQAGLG